MTRASDIATLQSAVIFCAKVQAFFLSSEDVGLPGCVLRINDVAVISGELAAIMNCVDNRLPDNDGSILVHPFEMARTKILLQRVDAMLRDYVKHAAEEIARHETSQE